MTGAAGAARPNRDPESPGRVRAAEHSGGLRIPPNCDLALGLRCVDKAEPGSSTWTMPADERFANPTGQVQGGILGALADSAAAAAVVTWARDRRMRVTVATTDLHVRFLRPAATGPGLVLTCTARVRSGGRRVVFAEADVTDADGTLVATASATCLLTPRD